MTVLKHISPGVKFRLLVLFVFAFNVFNFLEVFKVCCYFLTYRHNNAAIPWMDIMFWLIGINILQVVAAFVFSSKGWGWILVGLLSVNLGWFTYLLSEMILMTRSLWYAGIFTYVMVFTVIPFLGNGWLFWKVYNRFFLENKLAHMA